MKCKICGADKILFIDGSWVCDACEVGGIKS
jgi:rubredoxin